MTDEETRMRDMPMLDSDRQLMREEFDGFDDMTIDEWHSAVIRKLDSMFDFYNALKQVTNDD